MRRILLFLLFSCLGAVAQNVGPVSITSVQCAFISAEGIATVGVQVTGTWTGTLQPQLIIQGQPAANSTVTPTGSTTAQGTITGNGQFSTPVAGYSIFQVCGATVGSGTALVYLTGGKQLNTRLFGGSGSGSGTVSSCAAAGNAYYTASGTTVSCDTLIVDSGTGNLTFGAAAPTLSTSATNAPLTLAPNGTGAVIFNNGAAATPSLVFAQGTTTGFFSSTAANIGWSSAAVAAGILDANGPRVGSPGMFRWSSAGVGTAADTGLSRGAAAIIDMGNGTAADTSGKVKAAGYLSLGTTFTLSSNGCAAVTLTGGATIGSVASGTTGTCAFTVLMGNSATAANGWSCDAHDITTVADVINTTTPVSTTAASFTGTTVSGDVIQFKCFGY